MTDEVSSSVERRKPLSGLGIGPIGGMAARSYRKRNACS